MKNSEVVRKCVEFIEANLDKDLSLEFIAQKLNYSIPHLRRCFQQYTSFTLGYYIRVAKTEPAARALMEGLGVSEAAELNGFGDYYKLSHLFSDVYGVPPSSYSDVFGSPHPDLLGEVRQLNMHKTLSIITELIQLRNEKMGPIQIFNCSITVPFEAVLKKEILGLADSAVIDFCKSPLFRKDCHIISLQMLLLLLKKVLAYGDYRTITETDYSITLDDYVKIILLQLSIVDEVGKKNAEIFDKGHFLYSTYHLNNTQGVAGKFLRMYYMLAVLCRNKACFPDDIQNEYRDYYTEFSKKYGITTAQYEAFLFWELSPYYSGENRLRYTSSWRSVETTFKGRTNRELLTKTLSSLAARPAELMEWARNTDNEEWDFTLFQDYPFLLDDCGNYLSVSDYSLANAFFEKLFWLIRECYPPDDSRAMAFYGRLYEKYIQDLTRDAAKNGYCFIDEFKIGRRGNEAKSSDAYLKRSDKLLAVEAKGFSVLRNVMAANIDVERNNRKVFIRPVLEADKFAKKAIASGCAFMDVSEIYVIAVSMDSINANPFYYEEIVKEIEAKKTCDKVKYYYNFNIDEYEMLMSAVEQGVDIFPLLKEYFKQSVLPPFSNYLREKHENIDMTSFMKKWFDQASCEMSTFLSSNENT
ncbi:MAG: helix-turn-helix transcriptional regulator [Ruminococcaceae bacterium]|nr:helix-turn-helix transcriptional regulator [Oscillospiraceae bacterium]